MFCSGFLLTSQLTSPTTTWTARELQTTEWGTVCTGWGCPSYRAPSPPSSAWSDWWLLPPTSSSPSSRWSSSSSLSASSTACSCCRSSSRYSVPAPAAPRRRSQPTGRPPPPTCLTGRVCRLNTTWSRSKAPRRQVPHWGSPDRPPTSSRTPRGAAALGPPPTRSPPRPPPPPSQRRGRRDEVAAAAVTLLRQYTRCITTMATCQRRTRTGEVTGHCRLNRDTCTATPILGVRASSSPAMATL